MVFTAGYLLIIALFTFAFTLTACTLLGCVCFGSGSHYLFSRTSCRAYRASPGSRFRHFFPRLIDRPGFRRFTRASFFATGICHSRFLNFLYTHARTARLATLVGGYNRNIRNVIWHGIRISGRNTAACLS